MWREVNDGEFVSPKRTPPPAEVSCSGHIPVINVHLRGAKQIIRQVYMQPRSEAADVTASPVITCVTNHPQAHVGAEITQVYRRDC